MAIKIGHANINEKGQVSGGVKGDQNKREVEVRAYWNFGYDMVLRPKKPEVAEKSANFVETACANDNIGYGQGYRNSLFAQAVAVKFDCKKIVVKCECDCSSLIHVAVIAAGVNITYGSNAFTTRTMTLRLVQSGDYEKLTASKYLKSDKYLKRGDILVKTGSHTVMVLEDGSGVSPTSKKPDIIYAVKADGKWYPEVKNNTNYAGVENKAITDVMIKLSDGTPIKYRAHIEEDNRWLPWVTGYNKKDHNNGYAGNGKPIDAIEIKCDKYEIGYKVSSTANGARYYSEVKDSQNDYAGVFGRPIDKLICRVL
ncbi:MAG: hypothetical protein IJP13_01480 [Lachnospiraceae bacterium]|nr:hypothetical protein [Lachnospiraceae bacterium]